MNCVNVQSLSCFTHSLQLIIKDGVLTQPAVQQLSSTARSLVGHYHQSNPAFLQNSILAEHVLIQVVSTSWNNSLVEQKKTITAANTECQPPTELCTQQWNLAEKVIKLLKVFEEATHVENMSVCQ